MSVIPVTTKSIKPVHRAADPAIVMSGNPESDIWNAVDLGQGTWLCGLWNGLPGELRVRPRAHHEMFTVISGLVELIDDQGVLTRIGKGEAGFIPKGWSGIWRTVKETRKSYMLLKNDPDGDPK